MIRHTILFKAKSDTPNDEIQHALSMLEDLKNRLQGIFAINTGECQFHDEKSKEFFTHGMLQGITHAISIDFFDEESLENFFSNSITHPAKKNGYWHCRERIQRDNWL